MFNTHYNEHYISSALNECPTNFTLCVIATDFILIAARSPDVYSARPRPRFSHTYYNKKGPLRFRSGPSCFLFWRVVTSSPHLHEERVRAAQSDNLAVNKRSSARATYDSVDAQMTVLSVPFLSFLKNLFSYQRPQYTFIYNRGQQKIIFPERALLKKHHSVYITSSVAKSQQLLSCEQPHRLHIRFHPRLRC